MMDEDEVLGTIMEDLNFAMEGGCEFGYKLNPIDKYIGVEIYDPEDASDDPKPAARYRLILVPYHG